MVSIAKLNTHLQPLTNSLWIPARASAVCTEGAHLIHMAVSAITFACFVPATAAMVRFHIHMHLQSLRCVFVLGDMPFDEHTFCDLVTLPQLVASCILNPVDHGWLSSPASITRLKVVCAKVAYVIAIDVLQVGD